LALLVSVAVMVIYLTGSTAPYVGAAVVVAFPSMDRCLASLPVVLAQTHVSAAFCVDTSRILKG
jgi:hypothetical protein